MCLQNKCITDFIQNIKKINKKINSYWLTPRYLLPAVLYIYIILYTWYNNITIFLSLAIDFLKPIYIYVILYTEQLVLLYEVFLIIFHSMSFIIIKQEYCHVGRGTFGETHFDLLNVSFTQTSSSSLHYCIYIYIYNFIKKWLWSKMSIIILSNVLRYY